MIQGLVDVGPQIMTPAGIELEPLEEMWVVLRKAITVDFHFSILGLDGQWENGVWSDDVALMSHSEALSFAEQYDGVPANYADLVRKKRAEGPSHPSSVTWWDWM